MGWFGDLMGDVIPGVGGLLGQSSANKANAEEAAKSRKFQNTMWKKSLAASGSAHQRQVADMKAAGLNPMLSAMGGQGSAPPQGQSSATSAKQESTLGAGISSALDAKANKQQIQESKQRTDLTGSQDHLTQIKTGTERHLREQAKQQAITARLNKDLTESNNSLQIRRNKTAQDDAIYKYDEGQKRIPNISTPFGSIGSSRRGRKKKINNPHGFTKKVPWKPLKQQRGSDYYTPIRKRK